MRQSSAIHYGADEAVRSGDIPAVASVAFDCLTLPRLRKQEGKPLHLSGARASVLQVAKSMHSVGLLEKATGSKSLGEVVADSLTKWLSAIWGKPHYLGYSATLYESALSALGSESPDCDGITDQLRSSITKEGGLDPTEPHLCLMLQSIGRSDLLVGEGVESLESQYPGLGYEVMRAVESKGFSFGLRGSSWVTYATEYSQWCGASDEKEYSEYAGEPLEDYEGLTKADLEAAFPAKLWDSAKPLSDEELETIATTGAGEGKTAASLVLALRRLGDKAEGFAAFDTQQECELEETLEFNVLLGWKDFDFIYQVADDYARNISEGGMEMPGLGMVLIPANDPDWFRRMEQEWRVKAEAMHAVDSLLALIAKE